MNEQAMFFEKVRRKRRKITPPEKIAACLSRLADFYAVNKPGLKSMHISADDAWSLRELAARDEAGGTNEIRMAGFVLRGNDIEWRGFNLVEAP